MTYLKTVGGLLLVSALAACGGGGGNPGTTGSGTGSGSTTGGTTTTPVTSGTMTFELVNAAGTSLSPKQLSLTDAQYLKATVKDAKGAVVPFTRVTFSLDSDQAALVPVNGVQLTDASGVALIKVAPKSVNAQGVVGATAKATVNGTDISQSFDMNITPGVVQLQSLALSTSTLQKGQALSASVKVLVNGSAATSNSVSVNFSSTCGTVTPSAALVDASGKATTVVQTNVAGDCQVSAVYNDQSVAGNVSVTAPPVVGLTFFKALPELLYQNGSAGVQTSQVSFKVVDNLGDGVGSQRVAVSLSNTDGGLNFCGGPTEADSDASGIVTFSVCSGTLPATVQVHATLKSNPAVFADSNLLTVQTGLPTQRFFDISATQLNFYAGGYFTSKFNGNETEISVFAADRQGNPVPPGTPIVFVSEGGQLITSGASSCVIGTNGRCSIKLVGQDYRPMGSAAAGGDPRPGRVTVLAYADGEESFIDANYNNRYDAGEAFEDLGSPYLDKDENGSFVASYLNLVTGTNEGEFVYPIPAAAKGTSSCPTNSNVGLSVAKTCNGTWDGVTKVRRAITIVFSGGEIGSNYDASIPARYRTQVLGASNAGITVQLADRNGNPLPSTATVATDVLGGNGCSAKLFGSKIGNSTEPTSHTVTLDKCVGGETVLFKVTVGDKESAYGVTVPAP